MDSRGKRLFRTAALVIILFLGVAAYFIFFNKKDTPQTTVTFDKNLNPFDEKALSNNNGVVTIGDNVPISTSVDLSANPISSNSRERLRRVTSFPVSGFISYLSKSFITETITDEKTGKPKDVLTPITTHHVRYNDQRNGHLFDAVVEDTSILNNQITKTDLPSAEELLFNSTGTIGFLRYEKNNKIETFKLSVPGEKKITIPKVCTTQLTADLAIKSTGDEVKTLQDYLNYKFNQNLVLDGVFGKKTQTSIKIIQKEFGIQETGIVDSATRDALSKECIDIQQKATEAASNAPKDLRGALVPGYITQMVRDISTDTFFSLQKDKDKLFGVIQSTVNSQPETVFSSSFGEWMPQYANKNLITMTTYASSGIDGYMYGLNPTSKTFSKMLGPLQGLTTLTSPDGIHAIIATTEAGQIVNKIVNLSNGTSQSLPFTVLPEKCAWYSNDMFYCGVPSSYPTGVYPDDWYKGLISFSDTLWSYSIAKQESVQVALPPQTIDIERMEAYPDAGYLFFMNKINNELWSYRIQGDD